MERPFIRNVWADNLEYEINRMSEFVDSYPYIAFDTEFPGTLVRSLDKSSAGEYKALKLNVDMLKLIQLGVTLMDANGKLPVVDGRPCSWQLNFREFNRSEDLYAGDSIELLEESGIDFERNNDDGVDIQHFSELLMTSGLVLSDKVHWIGFATQYDVGYLLKALTCRPLPEQETEFFELVKLYFPNLYDIKYLPVVKIVAELQGGLGRLAEALNVKRVGTSHQAGSDSLLTAGIFFRLTERYFLSLDQVQVHSGKIAGLGEDAKPFNYI